MSLVRGANGLFQMMEPWKLKKEGQIDKLNATMAVTMETARVVGTLLEPIVPSFTQCLLGKFLYDCTEKLKLVNSTSLDSDKLGVRQEERSWDFARVRWSTAEVALGDQRTVLFPRIKSE